MKIAVSQSEIDEVVQGYMDDPAMVAARSVVRQIARQMDRTLMKALDEHCKAENKKLAEWLMWGDK